jgi:predicted nucleic acid-binding protein
MKVLIDECAPKALKVALAARGFDCTTVQEAGWSGKENGELLALADASFEALARLVRMKQLDSSDWIKARKLAKRLADSWSVIQPSDALRAKSAQLVDRFDLRAADSFQLAAALEWCEDAPQGRVFLTADQKLREAALLSGFDAKQM